MKNSDSVVTAWDDNKLVGLINSLDDGVMTAYVLSNYLISSYYLCVCKTNYMNGNRQNL